MLLPALTHTTRPIKPMTRNFPVSHIFSCSPVLAYQCPAHPWRSEASSSTEPSRSPPDSPAGTHLLCWVLSLYTVLFLRQSLHVACSRLVTGSPLALRVDKQLFFSVCNSWAASWAWGGAGQRQRDERRGICSGKSSRPGGILAAGSLTVLSSVL